MEFSKGREAGNVERGARHEWDFFSAKETFELAKEYTRERVYQRK